MRDAVRTTPRAINVEGQVVGNTSDLRSGAPARAFTWKDGTWLCLDAAPSFAAVMNNVGLAAGMVGTSPNGRAPIWDTRGCFPAPSGPPRPDAGRGPSPGDGGRIW